MNLSDMVTSSVLARGLALFMLALVFVLAVIVAFIDYLNGRAIPDLISGIIWTGLGLAGGIVGINFGVVLQPAPHPQTEKEP